MQIMYEGFMIQAISTQSLKTKKWNGSVSIINLEFAQPFDSSEKFETKQEAEEKSIKFAKDFIDSKV